MPSPLSGPDLVRDLPLPRDRVWTDAERLAPFARDEAATGVAPLAVVFPESTAEVSAVLKWANERRVPVVPRGAGSGLSGAAIPVPGAIVLSLTRLNTFLRVDAADLTVEVHPGVITGEVRRAAETHNLLYAPIPASVDFCTIGGNVATNAGGLCAVKYGATREHVLGLEAVLATGEIIRTGGRFQKSSTGYNLTQLLCGSEGTLAVITGITLKLLPLPAARMTMLVPFDSADALARGVVAILGGSIIPPTMEFLPRAAVRCVLEKHPDYAYPFPERAASLLVEMDGPDPDVVAEQITLLSEVLKGCGAGEPAVAMTPARREELWTLRKQVRDSIANSGDYVEADGVAPKRALPALYQAALDAGAEAGLDVISYGHAGDGNLHTYFRRGDLRDDAAWAKAGDVALTRYFRDTVALGGTISGEHGIGSSKRKYLPLAMAPEQIELLRRIKSAFDPHGILNPHKVLPD